jgi:hypothetical protein
LNFPEIVVLPQVTRVNMYLHGPSYTAPVNPQQQGEIEREGRVTRRLIPRVAGLPLASCRHVYHRSCGSKTGRSGGLKGRQPATAELIPACPGGIMHLIGSTLDLIAMARIGRSLAMGLEATATESFSRVECSQSSD